MERLIAKGLMFGDLVPVESPVLVERYRRAMRHLTGKDTALSDFHVDISGFSPEVGDEIGDPHYLNPPGSQRQFILLTLDQRDAPLLNAQFSTSRGILRQFMDRNAAALFALTARDAVAGELVGSHYAAETAARLLEGRRVSVEADTTGGAVAAAGRLEGLVARFKSEPDGWWDDRLIAEMIEVAGVTGDLTRNPVKLEAMSFQQDSFWTARFGGLYVLRDGPAPGVVSVGDPAALGALPVPEAIPMAERGAVARFLARNDLVEPIVEERGARAAAILRQKMDFIVADVAGSAGELPERATRAELRRLARRHAGRLPPEWEGLASLVAWAEEGAGWPRITSDHPAYFYTLRARRRPNADLVNMLLAELTPLDVRQLFICHKEAFYRHYRTWPEAKRAYVAELLAGEYQLDKAGTRAALFGPEPGMAEAGPPPLPAGPWARAQAQEGPPPLPEPARPAPAMLDAVGPWGSVRAEARPRRQRRRRDDD